jgi:ribosomal protein L11 methyltransferase
MYSLRLVCSPEHVDLLSGELWDAGTAGVQEFDKGDAVVLSAAFESNDLRIELLQRFASYSPEWHRMDATDWVQQTQRAWPGREVGDRLFLAPVWCTESTPAGRERVVHNPGLACGTGEHPCTQLALTAVENCVTRGCRVVDIGTGSGILALGALRLGASIVIGVDTDVSALQAARENFALNDFVSRLIAGSADCVADGCSDVTVANISGTVLLSISEDLVRITCPGGWLILTGFPESEAGAFRMIFPEAEVLEMGEWRCLIIKRPRHFVPGSV